MAAVAGNRRWKALGDEPRVKMAVFALRDPFEIRVRVAVDKLLAEGDSRAVQEQIRREHGSIVLQEALERTRCATRCA